MISVSSPSMGEGYEDLARNGPSRSWMGVISPLHPALMKKHPPPISIMRARELRRTATDAELQMKWLLKESYAPFRFRFQVPIRHFICDFASHRLKVVVEIDGGQHSVPGDAQRTADIEAEGYRIIRFWNNEVLENAEGCLIQLAQFLGRDHPHPASTRKQVSKSAHPSPIKGEERQ